MYNFGSLHCNRQHWSLRSIALFLAVCLLFAGIPVSAAAAESQNTENNYVDLNADTVSYKPGMLLIQEKDFSITTNDLYALDNGYICLELIARNTGRKSLDFRGVCSTIEGYDVGTTLYQTIRPGNQATITLLIDALPLAAVGIQQIGQLDIRFDVLNDETYETLYDGCAVTIPLGIPIDMEYYPYGKIFYEDSFIKLSLLGSVQVDHRSSPSLIFQLDNKLDGPIMVRNDGDFSVDNSEYYFYSSQRASAYSNAVFSLASADNFFQDFSGNTVTMEFPLQICTGNRNALIDTQASIRINRDGKIQSCNVTAEKNRAYEKNMGEYNRNTNMFVGMFRNYKPLVGYIDSLRNKYPENLPRYYDGRMSISVSEWLVLYLANLEDNGFRFGIIERPDLCSEEFYVVELTENGKSVIQISFTISDVDPKYADIITLGCSTEGYKDVDRLNFYIAAMWYAYDTLNVRMTAEKYNDIMEHSEISKSDAYGILFRGACDGLGYLFSAGNEIYLSITPDLTLPAFYGMKMGDSTGQNQMGNLRMADTGHV